VLTNEQVQDDLRLEFDGSTFGLRIPVAPDDHPSDPRRVILAALSRQVKDKSGKVIGYFPKSTPFQFQLDDGRQVNISVQLQVEGWLDDERDVKKKPDLEQRADTVGEVASPEKGEPLRDKDGKSIKDKEGNVVEADPEAAQRIADAFDDVDSDGGSLRE
jgi:hypothetical protein